MDAPPTSPLARLHRAVAAHLPACEMTGVIMRIGSFSMVSWLGAASPFALVWSINTADAVLLSWCALIKRDRAYTLLNVFWVAVSVVGLLRATSAVAH